MWTLARWGLINQIGSNSPFLKKENNRQQHRHNTPFLSWNKMSSFILYHMVALLSKEEYTENTYIRTLHLTYTIGIGIIFEPKVFNSCKEEKWTAKFYISWIDERIDKRMDSKTLRRTDKKRTKNNNKVGLKYKMYLTRVFDFTIEQHKTLQNIHNKHDYYLQVLKGRDIFKNYNLNYRSVILIQGRICWV